MKPCLVFAREVLLDVLMEKTVSRIPGTKRPSDFESGVCFGTSLHHSEVMELDGNSKLVFGVAVSRGGTQMCSVSNSETVQVWDARTAEQSDRQ